MSGTAKRVPPSLVSAAAREAAIVRHRARQAKLRRYVRIQKRWGPKGPPGGRRRRA